MQQLLLFILLVVSIAIVVLILLQHGKGADAGAAFGSGASSTVFGSQGSTSFLMKLTGVLVAIFFAVCILLTRLASVETKPPGPTEKPLPVQTAPRQAATTVPTTMPSAPKDSAASTVPSTPKK